jgi:CRP-like cAMP-binding protein
MLLELVERSGMADERGQLLPLPLSRGELASLVACRVESVVRVLRAWVAEGVVDSLPGGVLLRAPESLRELVAE